MECIQSINAVAEKRIHQYTAYLATLYYFEIMSLMVSLLFLYGKIPAIALGVTLSLLLAYHIIQIAYKKNLHRIIQLFIIDIHAAFAVGYLYGSARQGIDAGFIALIIIVMRSVILAGELPLLYYLTKDAIVKKFT